MIRVLFVCWGIGFLQSHKCAILGILRHYKSGMNPKTLQYLTGHSDIGVTLNPYTHLGLQDATEEITRMQEARNELDKQEGKKMVPNIREFKVV